MAQYVKQFEPLWGEWFSEEKLGAGSYGNVWKVYRMNGEKREVSAVKEVVVPASKEVFEAAKLEGLDREGAKHYFRKILDKTLKEIELMKALSECQNIVQFKEYTICDLEETDRFGWVVFIRMELLDSVKNMFLDRRFQLNEIAKIGIDICKALEMCELKGIINQDIKPDNLFYDSLTNTYKLGDFGIAKQLDRATANEKGRPGTLSYMSPEVFRGEQITNALDLYALGMILYRLLNHFRMPFLPEYPRCFTPDERDAALLKRLEGAQVPLPLADDFNGEKEKILEFCKIVTKSVDSDPEKRYKSAAEFRNEIEKLKF